MTLVLLWAGVVDLAAPPAMAAEILSIRNATLLQIGDQNRSYGVRLACVAVDEASSKEALGWLQKHGSRGTRVNLRPIGDQDGLLLARVSILRSGLDLGEGLVANGLATAVPCEKSLP
ncbi:MAG: hypothetical protein ACKOYK_11785 [Cyanobium sp.]